MINGVNGVNGVNAQLRKMDCSRTTSDTNVQL